MSRTTTGVLLMLVGAIASQTCSCALAAATQRDLPPPSLTNIALHRPYTLTPPPNYPLTTDPGDATDLTDGRYVESPFRSFWTNKGAVGWESTNAVITLDLGTIEPIRGASFDTAAGSAGVHWPGDILVLASDDGTGFHELGNLTTLSHRHGAPPDQGYARYEYWTDALKGHGRYVSFVVFGTPYIFSDEIQVFRGDAAWLKQANPSASFPNNPAAWYSLRQMTINLDSVKAQAHLLGAHSRRAAGVEKQMDEIERRPAAIETQPGDPFLHPVTSGAGAAQILHLQAKLWKAVGLPDLSVWQSNPWEPLSIAAVPPRSAAAQLDVEMMRGGEYRSAAFNLSNASQTDAVIRLTITGLPGGVNPPYVIPYEVEWTGAPDGTAVASELLPVALTGGAYTIHVPSGLTRQVWLTFHPAGIAPGVYMGAIHLESSSFSDSIPTQLHIYAVSFPARTTLHLGGWDYSNEMHMYGVTPENRAALIQALQAHFVDSPWATNTVMPPGTYRADGAMTHPPDTTPFDNWIRQWPDVAQYCVFLNVGASFGGSPMGTPLFDRKVGEWISFWSDHVKARGIAPARLTLLLIDEPHIPAQTMILSAWLGAVARELTGVTVLEEPIYADPHQAEKVLEQVEQLVASRARFVVEDGAYRRFFEERKAAGQNIAFYGTDGPAMNTDPYAYYRLQAWLCWREGAVAEYFWSFADFTDGSASTTAALKTGLYSPLFLSRDSVHLSKQMEAIREGVEDYQYLVMLKDAAVRSTSGDAAAHARTLLADAPRLVCDPAATAARQAGQKGRLDPFSWQNALDRSTADRERVAILNTLSELP